MTNNDKSSRTNRPGSPDRQPGLCVHRERHEIDGYAQAIPMDELVALAYQCASDCGDCTTSLQIEREVRARLCPCILCDECIVNAVVQEVARQRGKFVESGYSGCHVSVRFHAELSSFKSNQ